MSTSPEFIAHVRELMAGLGPVQARRMFGGYGLYADGIMFALVIEDVLHLKTDATTRAAFAADGTQPFTYQGKGRMVETSYWRAPDRLHDDADEMCNWARIAITVARRARTKSTAAKPGATAATSRRRRVVERP